MRKNTSKAAYLWYANVGKWRIGSRWVSAPRARQLRRDKAGRLLDASGRRVPASAVAPEPKPVRKAPKGSKAAKRKSPAKPPKTPKVRKGGKTPEKTKPPKGKAKPVKTPRVRAKAKTSPKKTRPPTPPKSAQTRPKRPKVLAGLVWDGERWRRGGRFCPPPRAEELARDESGSFRDSVGSKVPPSAIRDLPLKLVRPKKRVMSKIRRGETIVDREFVSSSWRNNKPPTEAGNILQDMIERHCRKGPFEASDVSLYEHGLKFVGEQRLSPDIIERLSDLVGDKARIKYADTNLGTEVYLYLGNAPKDRRMAGGSFDFFRDLSEEVYWELVDYWGDMDWYVWVETDEALYG